MSRLWAVCMATPKAVRKRRTDIERRIRQRVRALRTENGLTLNEVAQKAGLTLDAVSKIEGGRRTPSLPTVIKLARALSVPPSELFAEEDPSLSPALRALVAALDDKSVEVQQVALDIVRSLLVILDDKARGKRSASRR